MLWDGLIVDPLSDWWRNGGRDQAIESAENIGRELGEILHSGLLAIFGMTDVLDGSVDAGASIAKSFAKGFLEGFDIANITAGLLKALGNIWNALPTWGKFLVGSKIAGGVSNIFLGGIELFKKAAKVISSASAGTGVLGFGAKTAITLGAGAGGASLGAGTLSAIGLSAVAGGVTASAGLIHAGKSAYRAYQGYKEGDEIKTRSNAAKAGLTATGTGAGAALGAAIGAHFFGIGAIPGALIGAGVGTVAGWFGEDKVAKNIESARYETEEMQKAIKSTNLSAEELAQTFQKEVYADMKSRFGEMELSLSEMQRLSEQVAWSNKIGAANNFLSAQQNTANSRQIFQTTSSDTGKWLWKARLGVVFDEEDKQEIFHSFDSYIQSASDYVSNKHNEFSTAVSLLFDIEAGQGNNILTSGSAYFQKTQEELTTKSQELTAKLNEYLSDGKLEAQYNVDGTLIVDEAAAIEDLQQQISDIMQKVSDSEWEAQLDLIKLKFGNGKLSLESFDGFLTQLDSALQSRMDTGEQAYITIAATAKLQYKDGQISLEEYQRQVQAAADAYNLSIDELRVKVENIALDILGDAYPEIGKSQLKNALEQSLKAGIDPINWTDEQTARFLNVEGLAQKAAQGIREKLNGVTSLLAKFGLTITPDFHIETDSSLAAKLATSLDILEPALKIYANIEANWEVRNVGDAENEILALVSPDQEYVIPISALAEANWTTGGDPFNPALLSPDGTQCIPINAVAELIWSSVHSQGLDTSEVVPPVTEPVQTTVPVESNVVASGGDGFDSSAITSQIPQSTEPVSVNVPVAATYNANPFEGKAEDFAVHPEYDFSTNIAIAPSYTVSPKFYGNKELFGIQNLYSVDTTVGVNVHYNVTKDPLPNLTSGVAKARGGVVGSNRSMGFSNGGMVCGGAQLITVAEEGTPEMIIPLGSQRHERGVKLWKTAGHMLGIDGFANGGIIGSNGWMAEPFERTEILFLPGLLALQARLLQQNRFSPQREMPDDDEENTFPLRRSSTQQEGENAIIINVGGVTIHVEVNGEETENLDIVAAIEEQKQEIADIISGAIKQAISEVFANTPLRGGSSL